MGELRLEWKHFYLALEAWLRDIGKEGRLSFLSCPGSGQDWERARGKLRRRVSRPYLREPCPHIHPQSDFKVRPLEQLSPPKMFIESRAGLVRSWGLQGCP